MFKKIQSVISEPLKFKAKLAIGEDAYVISARTWAGASRYVKQQSKDKVTVIPELINTPMDALAIVLFDLMVPLALKVATVDNRIDESERLHISRYFIREWGYNKNFVADAISIIESNITDFKIKDLAFNIAAFQKDNPDCNHQKMSNEIISFLTSVMESDGRIDEREEFAIEKIKSILKAPTKVNTSKPTFGSNTSKPAPDSNTSKPTFGSNTSKPAPDSNTSKPVVTSFASGVLKFIKRIFELVVGLVLIVAIIAAIAVVMIGK